MWKEHCDLRLGNFSTPIHSVKMFTKGEGERGQREKEGEGGEEREGGRRREGGRGKRARGRGRGGQRERGKGQGEGGGQRGGDSPCKQPIFHQGFGNEATVNRSWHIPSQALHQEIRHVHANGDGIL